MTDLMAHMANKQLMCDTYLRMSPEDRAVAAQQIIDAAAAKSKFNKFELVRVCLSPGVSLVGGLKALPHDHKDPEQHLDTRIMGWNMYAETMIACEYGDNPHLGKSTACEKNIRRRKGDDWFKNSTFKPDQGVTYVWDQDQFGPEFGKPGQPLRAQLISPHLRQGDWYVIYEKANGDWINRVLNESQMTLVK